MRKITFLVAVTLFLSITGIKAQDGIAFWSQSAGWSFDLNGDGQIDKTFVSGLPEASNITGAFVGDFNQDGFFDLCEVSQLEGNLATWYVFTNDGSNNFEPSEAPLFGLHAPVDKVLAGDFMGNGRTQISIRRDNEWGLWWIIHFWGAADDANFQFGIANTDVLLAGDLNADGKDDLVVFNAGKWKSTFTPETGFPTGATVDVENLAFGLAGNIPVILDYNGDGHNDFGVFDADDMEIGFNLYNASKPDNHGYSAYGRGSYDETYTVPTGLTPSSICAIKKTLLPTGIKSVLSGNNKISVACENRTLYINMPVSALDKNSEIAVSNIAGQKVFSTVIQGNGYTTVDLPAFNKGIYLITVKNLGTAKFIVK